MRERSEGRGGVPAHNETCYIRDGLLHPLCLHDVQTSPPKGREGHRTYLLVLSLQGLSLNSMELGYRKKMDAEIA